MKELPYDQELWASAGQYMAWIAPTRLKDPAEIDDFKRAGAQYLMHACNLIGSNKNVPFQCLTAANLLSKRGERAAARAFLERLLVISDDAELHDYVKRQLATLNGEEEAARARARDEQRLAIAVRDGVAFVSRVELDALGPRTDTAACAGHEAEGEIDCASSWQRRAEHQQPADAVAP